MYRKYQSALPANNLYLKHKWDLFDHESHLHRVRTMEPCVDSKPPRTFMHLYINLKRLQAEAERISEIQRENNVLMQRIADVMRGTGHVDHKNEYTPKSLNCWKRQSEMLNLAYENLTQHRRLLDVKAEYNHNKLEDSFMLHQKYKANILKYPQNWQELIREEEAMRMKMRSEFYEKERKMMARKRERERERRRAPWKLEKKKTPTQSTGDVTSASASSGSTSEVTSA